MKKIIKKIYKAILNRDVLKYSGDFSRYFCRIPKILPMLFPAVENLHK